MFAGSCHNIILQLQSAQAREAVQAHPNNARTVFHPTVNSHTAFVRLLGSFLSNLFDHDVFVTS